MRKTWLTHVDMTVDDSWQQVHTLGIDNFLVASDGQFLPYRHLCNTSVLDKDGTLMAHTLVYDGCSLYYCRSFHHNLILFSVGERLHVHVDAIAYTCKCNCIYMYVQSLHPIVCINVTLSVGPGRLMRCKGKK